MGKLTPTRHPYLFGGGISGLLIAGAVFAFVSTVAVVSEKGLPGSTSYLSTPPHDTLTIAGQGIVGEHSGASSVTALGKALAFAHPAHAVSGPPTAPNRRTEESRRTSAGSSEANGGTDAGVGPGPQHGGATPANPGQGGPLPVPSEGPPSPGQGHAAPAAGPPGLAKKPDGLSPGLAKKPHGLPPGLAKKPHGLPPGLAKKPHGLPPGHTPR
jgi:hypothetical protein